MAIKTKSLLKTRFEDGDIPLGGDFADLIDSSLNQTEDAHKLGPKSYDSSRNYEPDDTCLFSQGNNYQLYRANKSTTGAFVDADWDQVTAELDLTYYQAPGNIFIKSPETISFASGDSTDITSYGNLNFVGEKNTNIEGGESYIYLETPQVTFKSDEKFIFAGGGVAAYEADVSGNFTDRSLVDKAYVDNAITTGTEGVIDDVDTVNNKTWSSERITSALSTAVSDIVSASPDALNTLKELADALGSDPNFATTITNLISAKLSTTDVVNDLTSTETAKPLSAAQGKVLKELIDGLTGNTNGVPSLVSNTGTPNKVGTSDAFDLQFLTGNKVSGLIDPSSRWSIGHSGLPTAFADVAAATAEAASLRIRQTTTSPSTPIAGDFWLESANNRFKHRKNENITTDVLCVHDNVDLAGPGNRMMQTDALGNVAAIDEVVELFSTDPTIRLNLENQNNWTSGVYAGPILTRAYQGLMHSDGQYLFLFINSKTPIRLLRS